MKLLYVAGLATLALGSLASPVMAHDEDRDRYYGGYSRSYGNRDFYSRPSYGYGYGYRDYDHDRKHARLERKHERAHERGFYSARDHRKWHKKAGKEHDAYHHREYGEHAPNRQRYYGDDRDYYRVRRYYW